MPRLGADRCLRYFLNSLSRLDPVDYVDRHVSQDGFRSQADMDLCVRSYPGAAPVLKGRVQLLLADLPPESAAQNALLNAVASYEVAVPLWGYLGISYALILQEMGKTANWKPVLPPVSLGKIAGSADQRGLSAAQAARFTALTGVCCEEPLFFYKGKHGEAECSARAWHIDRTKTVYTLTFSDTAGCTEYLNLPRFDCASLVALSAPPLSMAVATIRSHLETVVDGVIVGILNDVRNATWIASQRLQTDPHVVYAGLPNVYYHRSPKTDSTRFHVAVVA